MTDEQYQAWMNLAEVRQAEIGHHLERLQALRDKQAASRLPGRRTWLRARVRALEARLARWLEDNRRDLLALGLPGNGEALKGKQ